ncbi:ethyl tert-butyl ether degradation ethd [Fusarium flagelliforme]|uniref:Ethyl tert-butyl ether degradation ethd n=1 Tax=Fusarium flagelliforme TaxID=2675880 RepID=A0A395MJT3_9HYPO|nr:ethyl tert-butyl ether degradation ethd [Fusarium flagelliforme]
MATIIIQYPSGHDFDVDYYLKTHMPLAEKTWSSKGLKSAEVIQLGGDSPYQIYSILRWESMAAFQAAAGSEESKAVHDDVKNFTTAKAEVRVGATVGEAKL